jgi:hypothetical protein
MGLKVESQEALGCVAALKLPYFLILVIKEAVKNAHEAY